MPPPSAASTLTDKQIDTLKRWVAEGAKWHTHWAFIPPERPPLPEVKNKAWPRNPIDFFVLADLERAGLQPSPEADPVTLIRRLSLDLTGLPPTIDEVDAFVKEYSTRPAERDSALGKVVDRLLKSPRYGERMAQRWLDGARYADTNGYQTDGERTMWRWRDWVIDAFNDNMPFDRFTIEQIAGDMLPGATMEQKIATGFNRNHRGNSEGGVIPEEYACEYVVDRVDTTSTVWLGLTAGCARCHSHKYDPITQKEFYQIFAYFNNVPERGRALKYGNSPPFISTPTRDQQKNRLLLQPQLRASRKAPLRGDAAQVGSRPSSPGNGLSIPEQNRGADWTFTAPIRLQPLPAGRTGHAVLDSAGEDGVNRVVPGKSVGKAGDLRGKAESTRRSSLTGRAISTRAMWPSSAFSTNSPWEHGSTPPALREARYSRA